MYDFLFDFYGHHLSISYRFRDIRLQCFKGLTLTFDSLKSSGVKKILYHSKGHIWLPIWLLWTPSLYLVPFSRYSTSKFLGFDLHLWPLKVIWGQKKIIHLERPYMTSYLTSMDTISLSHTVFEIFDFEVFRVWPWPFPRWPLGVKGQGQTLKTSKSNISKTVRDRETMSIDFLFDFYGHHLSISYRFRDIRLRSF